MEGFEMPRAKKKDQMEAVEKAVLNLQIAIMQLKDFMDNVPRLIEKHVENKIKELDGDF